MPRTLLTFLFLWLISISTASASIVSSLDYSRLKAGLGLDGIESSYSLSLKPLGEKYQFALVAEGDARLQLNLSGSYQLASYWIGRLSVPNKQLSFEGGIGKLFGEAGQYCLVECVYSGYVGRYSSLSVKMSAYYHYKSSFVFYVSTYRLLGDPELSGIGRSRFKKSGGISVGVAYDWEFGF